MKLTNIYAETPGLLEHSLRVFFFVRQVIDYLPDGLILRKQAEDILFAALLHDIGKATWSDQWFSLPRHSIRNVDWTVMQTHPIQSVNIIKSLGIPVTVDVQKLISGHHERPGKKGYPNQIEPDFAQIVLAAADVFCACTENRTYRSYPMDTNQAIIEVASFAPTMVLDSLRFAAKQMAA